MMEHAAKAADTFVMGLTFWVATAIFLLSYALIISEKIHKTTVAVFGAGIMVALGILTQEDAFHSIDLGVDWNVIFLLISTTLSST